MAVYEDKSTVTGSRKFIMSLTTICVSANALHYPEGGGVLWEYLNWTLGFRSLGCRVIWMEGVKPGLAAQEVQNLVAALKQRLERYGLAESLALVSRSGKPLAPGSTDGCLDIDAAGEADLLVNMGYVLPSEVVGRFRRSILVDVDPGLTQIWISEKQLSIAEHDLYFTTGETVGQPGSLVPKTCMEWHYTRPCVALEMWPVCEAAAPDAPFTTVSQWYGFEWVKQNGQSYYNDKREGFRPFLDLPRHSSQPLELAICLGERRQDKKDRNALLKKGWRVRDAASISSTPWDYQGYIQRSRGEFSCVKPSCVKLQNAWMSDRTICYLASGRPAVMQHTGPSRFLPDAAGLFRFRDLEEAARGLETVAADYDRQSRLARSLVEDHFDARKNLTKVLERALN
jgi:hypothetical protein